MPQPNSKESNKGNSWRSLIVVFLFVFLIIALIFFIDDSLLCGNLDFYADGLGSILRCALLVKGSFFFVFGAGGFTLLTRRKHIGAGIFLMLAFFGLFLLSLFAFTFLQ